MRMLCSELLLVLFAAIAGCDESAIEKPMLCGNGRIDEGESCDDQELAGLSCRRLGFLGGELACGSDCVLSTDGCFNACGNGVADLEEACDGSELRGVSCAQFGLSAGALTCVNDCSGFDTSECGRCGDGTRDEGEVCDGADVGSATCADVGLHGGKVLCTAQCTALSFEGCEMSCAGCVPGCLDCAESDRCELSTGTCRADCALDLSQDRTLELVLTWVDVELGVTFAGSTELPPQLHLPESLMVYSNVGFGWIKAQRSPEGGYSLSVPPGAYDVELSVETELSGRPIRFPTVKVVIAAQGSIVLEYPGFATVRGRISRPDGLAPPSETEMIDIVSTMGAWGRDTFGGWLVPLDGELFELLLPAGSWSLKYHHGDGYSTGSPDLPFVDALTVLPGQELELDVSLVEVDFELPLPAGPLPWGDGPYDRMFVDYVALDSPAQGFCRELEMPSTGDEVLRWSETLTPGHYSVSLSRRWTGGGWLLTDALFVGTEPQSRHLELGWQHLFGEVTVDGQRLLDDGCTGYCNQLHLQDMKFAEVWGRHTEIQVVDGFYDAWVPAGRYTVWLTSYDIPGVWKAGLIDLNHELQLPIDARTVEVFGEVTVNGQPMRDNQYEGHIGAERGRLFLLSAEKIDGYPRSFELPIGPVGPALWETRLFAGRYVTSLEGNFTRGDFFYPVQDVLPATVEPDAVLTLESDGEVPLDLSLTDLTLTFVVGGVVAEHYSVYVSGEAGGEQILSGVDPTMPVAPGLYELFVELRMPWGDDAILIPDFEVPTQPTFQATFEWDTVRLSGHVSTSNAPLLEPLQLMFDGGSRYTPAGATCDVAADGTFDVTALVWPGLELLHLAHKQQWGDELWVPIPCEAD